jgi:hypothetical protein
VFPVGITQSNAIKALTQDIVWYENQTVELNGKQYTALMPRLYLAGATLEDLSKTPQALFTGNIGNSLCLELKVVDCCYIP